MSDEVNETTELNELEMLKAKAERMGVKYHPAIGPEKLREKINDALSEKEVEARAIKAKQNDIAQMKRDANKLVRVQITCMNPAKKALKGEIFTVGNRVIGTIKKFIPYNAPDGFHVPQMLLERLEDRHFRQSYTVKINGQEHKRSQQVKEFAIAKLPPLTVPQLRDIAERQLANGYGK